MELPSLNEVEIEVKSKDLNNLKILHLSDLHINKKTKIEDLKNLVDYCNYINCDFISITGDIIDCKVKHISNKLEILNHLNKKTFFISGNHDVFYGLEDLKFVLNKLAYLDNDSQTLIYNNKEINITGLSDRFSKLFKVKRDEKHAVNLLKKNINSIFLSHQPKDYKIALKGEAKLFLCGHTHGGQIYPFHYIVKLFQPFLNGLIYIKDTAIYVNKGLGFWGINYRFKADAEITLLTLKAKGVQ